MDVVEACCVLCGEDREMEDYLFASYPLTWGVWSKIYSWFDSLFQGFLQLFWNRKHALKGIL
jgi:hypothetical protein